MLHVLEGLQTVEEEEAELFEEGITLKYSKTSACWQVVAIFKCRVLVVTVMYHATCTGNQKSKSSSCFDIHV